MNGNSYNREIVRLPQQQVWGKSAVLNFALGGSGAGLYIVMFFSINILNAIAGASHNFHKIFAPTLVAIGFLALACETRFPLRIVHLANNLYSSWMSRETLFGVAFIILAGLDFFRPHSVFELLAVFSALGYLVSQSFILYRSVAVTAWNTEIAPLTILLSSIYGGMGWCLMMIGAPELTNAKMLMFVFAVILLNALAWLFYVLKAVKIKLSEKKSGFRFWSRKKLSLFVAQIIPIAALSLIAMSDGFRGHGPLYTASFRTLSALLILAFSFHQKSVIIKLFSQFRSINLGFPEQYDGKDS